LPDHAPAERPGPGRPSTGARERILDAALHVLKTEGYAGLTTAKVAARSGQNKALIGYHFGSKQGLVAAAARELRTQMTEELLARLGRPRSLRGLASGLLDGLWAIMDEDEGLARLYFDLAARSVVDPEVRRIMQEMKAAFREVLVGLLRDLEDGPPPRRAEAAAVYLIAGFEGLALERLDRGDTPALARATPMFVTSAAVAGAR
jgi:AcrR family transcriptional regulator